MKKTFVYLAVFVSLFCLLTSISIASSTRTLTLKDLCDSSNLIVEAHVNSITPFYLTVENQKMIFSRINMNIKSTYKGHVEKGTLEIITFGGTLDGKSIYAVDGPRYEVGETTLLFLEKKPNRYVETHFVVQGLSQGKFIVENDIVYRNCNVPLEINNKENVRPVTKKEPIDKSLLLSEISQHIKE